MALPLLDESLQRSIDLIRRKVIEMSGLAEQALKSALQALTEGNRTLAYSVVLRDQYIDEAEKELDRLCLEFLVRQQPVAGHLRFVYAVIKINNELERIGDYAESVARQFLAISSVHVPISYDKFHEIANLAIPMLHDAARAFVDQNAELARAVMEREKMVDNIRTSIHSELIHLREQGKLPLEALAPLLIVASRFERVADQACNMCEEVLYMCTGEYIKHQGTEVFRVLFVDNGNSSRSQMAEGIGNALGLNKFIFSSAGISPRGGLDPRAVRFMQEKGINISRQNSKSIEQIPNLEHYQVIIALSKDAHRAFPSMPTKVVSIPWELPDPVQVRGSAEEVHSAYEHVFQFLELHIRDLVQAVLGEENLNK
ncbi:MAG: phosphate signaling complex protein PhoU [bacterium]